MATLQSPGNFQPLSLPSGNSLPNRIESAKKPEIKEASKVEAVKQTQSNINSDQVEVRNESEVAEMASKLENFSKSVSVIQRSLSFKVDDATGTTVIRVVDRKTDETIRQIPPEELLTLSKRLKELNEDIDTATGVFIQTKA